VAGRQFFRLRCRLPLRVGLRAAALCSNDFGRLLAIGLTVLVVGQALVNMSVVLGLLPTKGLTLPFISYGGTSLIVMMGAAGILLSLSVREENTVAATERLGIKARRRPAGSFASRALRGPRLANEAEG